MKVVGLSFNVITNRTKLKNNTPNAFIYYYSPYAMIVFDFVFFEKAKFVRY